MKRKIIFFIWGMFSIIGVVSAAGTPGSHYTDNIFADCLNRSASFINPAFITDVDQARLHLGYASLLGSEAQISYLGLVIPAFWSLKQSFGFQRIGINDEIEEANLYNKTGDKFSFSDDMYFLSYAYRILPYLSLGTNITIAQKQAFPGFQSESGTVQGGSDIGFGVDLGMAFNPLFHYKSGYFDFGINLQNLLAPKIQVNQGGQYIEYYPTTLRVSSIYTGLENRFSGMVDVIVEDLMFMGDTIYKVNHQTGESDTNDVPSETQPATPSKNKKWNFGLKYMLADWLSAKAGYNKIRGLKLGFGVSYKRVNIFRFLEFEYDVFIPIVFKSEISPGITNVFSFVTRFGPSREEMHSRRIFNRIRIAPMNDFNAAMQLYLQKKYWEAAFAFGKVMALYPYFHKVDIATFYLGKCFEFLMMNNAAKGIFSQGLKNYTTSDFRPKYIYGRQNIDYKEGNYVSALNNYAFISNLYRNSDIKPDADYIAAQTKYYKDGIRAFGELRGILNQIRKGNPNYLYAQYTMGITNVKQRKLVEAEHHFKNIISSLPKSASEQVLISKTNVLLGHLYQDKLKLRDAISFYTKVPVGSRYYDEALLGLAWCYIKANSNMGAVQYAKKMIAETPKSRFVPEAYLVRGYAATLDKDFSQAQTQFKKCISLCKIPLISKSQISSEKASYKTFLRKYNKFQKRIIEVVQKKPTPDIQEVKSKLRTEFVAYNSNVEKHIQFMMELGEQKKFRKSKKRLIEDAEYALATAIRLEKSARKYKVIKKSEEKIKKIDREQRQIEEELRRLERLEKQKKR